MREGSVGVDFFVLGSLGAAFIASCLVHAFLPRTRWKVVAAVAMIPCLVLFAVGPVTLGLYAIVFSLSFAGSACGGGGSSARGC